MSKDIGYVPGDEIEEAAEFAREKKPALLIGTLAERQRNQKAKSPTSMANLIKNAVNDARKAGKIPPEDE